MNKITLIHEGKAKKVWQTEDPDLIIQEFKDDATAFNAKKHQVIEGKGVLNNRISEYLFQHLNDIGVPTHVLWGDSDPALQPALGEGLEPWVPRLTVRVDGTHQVDLVVQNPSFPVTDNSGTRLPASVIRAASTSASREAERAGASGSTTRASRSPRSGCRSIATTSRCWSSCASRSSRSR